jgi:hemoglobin-like flavoprotein
MYCFIMSITSAQKDLVQSTFKLVAPIADTAASMFYNRLFTLKPELRALFHTDTSDQGRKLMQMIGIAVAGLDNLDGITPAVQALGRRHVGYGVKDEDYATVGAALLWTLEQGLGEAFTPEVREAWLAVYTALVSIATDAIPA